MKRELPDSKPNGTPTPEKQVERERPQQESDRQPDALPAENPVRDYYAELCASKELPTAIADRVAVLLGMPIEEAIQKIAATKPEVLTLYKEAFAKADEELEPYRLLARKAGQKPEYQLRNFVVYRIMSQLRSADCAEILACALLENTKDNVFEKSRITQMSPGSATVRFNNKAMKPVVVNQNADSGHESLTIGMAMESSDVGLMTKTKEWNFLVPALLLRKDFWTMLSYLSGENYLPEAFPARRVSPETCAASAKAVDRWFGGSLQEDESKFFAGRNDKRQKALRDLDVKTAWSIALKAGKEIVEPAKRRENKQRHDDLIALYKTEQALTKAQTVLQGQNSFVLRMKNLFNSSSAEQRAKAERTVAETQNMRDSLVLKLAEQQRRFKQDIPSFDLAIETSHIVEHYDPKPGGHYTRQVLAFWLKVAENEFLKIADRDLARDQLEQYKKKP